MRQMAMKELRKRLSPALLPQLKALLASRKPESRISAVELLASIEDPAVIDKMLYMTGGQVSCPIVFRGPNGAALQLSAQHSQACETWYVHGPGIKVVTPATPADAKGLLKAAIRDNDPVAFMEGEILYNFKGEVPDDDDFVIPLGVADVKREGSDVSIITHGKTIYPALQAAQKLEKDGISAEVLDLRSIRPLDMQTVLASVRKTNRAVYLEEGWAFAGIGAQITSMIQDEAFDDLDAPVVRISQADVPMPYAKNLENFAKPTVDRVVKACNRVLYRNGNGR
jgi:pyruvate dehydrogenase E1 component beta subunit